jgi:PHP domain
MFLADLHVHSNFSDGQMSLPELVDFYGSRGFGAVAVTDHICEKRTFLGQAADYLNLSLNEQNFLEYLDILADEAKRAWRAYRMVVIPGFELSKNSWFNHRSAHILGLGISRFMTADGDIKDLARSIRAQEEFDAWEVASGPHFFTEVQESGLPLLATSDLHRKTQIESWKTVFTCERSQSAIFEAIRKQDLGFAFYREPQATFCPAKQSRGTSGQAPSPIGDFAPFPSF